MRVSLVAFGLVCLTTASIFAQQSGTVNWTGLGSLEVITPNAKLADAAKERFYKSQFQRAFRKTQHPVFAGLAKVTDISEKDGKWTIKAVRELTDDEQLKHKIAVINRANEPAVGSFSAAALSAGGNGPQGRSFDREPSVTWTVDKKPKYAKGHVMDVRGEISSMTWDDKTIAANVSAPTQ